MQLGTNLFDVFERENFTYRTSDPDASSVKKQYDTTWNEWKVFTEQKVISQLHSHLKVERTESWQNSGALSQRYWTRLKYPERSNSASCIAIMINKKNLRVYLEWHKKRTKESENNLKEHNNWINYVNEWIAKYSINPNEYRVWTSDEEDLDDYNSLHDFLNNENLNNVIKNILNSDGNNWIRIGKVFSKQEVTGWTDATVEVVNCILELEYLYKNTTGKGNNRSQNLLEQTNKTNPITFSQFVKKKGFNFTEDLLNNYVNCLRTKPFVILSGISGTGKTKIAQFFAEYMCGEDSTKKTNKRYSFISVRPDWLDNRALLGFYNPITEQYHITDLLKIILRAKDDRENPYFVIFDEMNLAKVEYYFSDFLSCLESKRVSSQGTIFSEAIQLHDMNSIKILDEDGTEYSIPAKIEIPDNIYFTGTVNIDETTYMFSPKVLDRSNVIEINTVDLKTYRALLMGNKKVKENDNNQYASPNFVNLFTNGGTYHERLIKKSFDLNDQLLNYYQKLEDINTLLQAYNMHFGYRVVDEVLFYLKNTIEASYFNLDKAFDYQVLQRILPKFHGNQRKLEKPLSKLLGYFFGFKLDEIAKGILLQEIDIDYLESYFEIGNTENKVEQSQFNGKKPILPMSAYKVFKMIQKLNETGFVSFIE